MKFIYTRVSTIDQNVDQQTEYLQQRYVTDKVYSDKLSGKSTDRPEFQKMISQLRTGDSVIVYDISRIGRNVKDVLEFAEHCTNIGVSLTIDRLGGVDITSSTGKLVFTTLAAVAEMQRTEMLEKQSIGIDRAKAEGKFKGRQVSKESKDEFSRVNELVQSGLYSLNKAISLVGMNRSKYYRLKKAATC